MPFACGSFPSHLGIEQVTSCRTRSPTRSLLGKAPSKAFLSKYFSPGKTAKLRADITSFAQQDGESLYEVTAPKTYSS